MSTSGRTAYLKRALWQLGWAMFLAFFGAVYERFSHEVYSYWMIYAFAFPLVLGVLPWSVLALFDRSEPVRSAAQLWDSGVLTLAVGSVFAGVLEIYGTTNRLWLVYPAAGLALLLSGAVWSLTAKRKTGNNKNSSVE